MNDLTRLILLFARTLISDRCCWTSGVLARDRFGRPVSGLDDVAMSWCALGAVYRIADGDVEVFQRASDALDASARALYGVGIRAVNDSPSPFAHLAVLGAFDHAIDGLIETLGWPPSLLVGLGLADQPVDPGGVIHASTCATMRLATAQSDGDGALSELKIGTAEELLGRDEGIAGS